MKLKTNNLNKHGKIKNLLKTKAAKVIAAVVVVFSIGAISYVGSYIHQANQVAQLKELNDQLILEQRKLTKESENNKNNIAELKTRVVNQEAQNRQLQSQNSQLQAKNQLLQNSNDDLSKKYRELVTP